MTDLHLRRSPRPLCTNAHTHTHISQGVYKSEFIRKCMYAMMLLTALSLGTVRSQVACDDLELRVGATEELDCYRVKIPVYFRYIGAGTPPASFSACEIEVTGEVTGGVVKQCVAENGFTSGTVQSPTKFKVISPELPATFSLSADNEDPHFYVVVEAEPDGDFDLSLEVNSFYFQDGTNNWCAGLACGDMNERITYETDPLAGPQTTNCTSSNPELEFFIDEANISYDDQTAIVPVKVKRLDESSDDIYIDKLDFIIDVEDVYQNLGVDALSSQSFGTAEFSNGTIVFIPGNFTNELLIFESGGIAELITIELSAPSTPFAGGEANLNFRYARVKFTSDGECCSPATVDGSVVLDDHPFPCTDQVLPTVAIGESTIDDGKIIFPVSLEASPNSTIPITQLKVTIKVNTNGNMTLDEDAILNSLALESTISCPSGDDLTVNTSTGVIEYFICRTGNPGVPEGISMFDIVVSGGCGCVDDIRVSIAEIKRESSDACVTPIAATYDLGDACIVQNEGDVKMLCNEQIPVDGVQVCGRKNSMTCACGSSGCDVSQTTGNNGKFDLPDCTLGDDYTFTACKQEDTDIMCGVSTFDLVRIQQHILSVLPFTTPIEYIAADVNHSQHITTSDLIDLRKRILAVETEFDPEDWRLVPCDYDFPAQASEALNISWPLCLSFPAQYDKRPCFRAIKIGDVNCNCNPTQSAAPPEEQLVIRLKPGSGTNSSFLDMELEPEDFEDIIAFQFAMRLDTGLLEYDNFGVKDLPGVDANMFGLTDLEEGIIRVAWYDQSDTARTLDTGEQVFELGLNKLLSSADLEDIVLDETVMPALAYKSDGTALAVYLSVAQSMGASQEGEVEMHNEAVSKIEVQPCAESGVCLEISSTLQQEATLELYDGQGRVLYSRAIVLTQGRQRIEPQLPPDTPAGVYFYRLTPAKGEKISGKVIKY